MKYLYIDTTSNFLYTGVVENDNLICERKIIFDKVPRNPTGKIEKPKLRKMFSSDGLVAKQNEIK